MKNLILVIIIMTLVAVPAFSQKTEIEKMREGYGYDENNLRGVVQVRDNDQYKPLEGAVVNTYHPITGLLIEDITDEHGKFILIGCVTDISLPININTWKTGYVHREKNIFGPTGDISIVMTREVEDPIIIGPDGGNFFKDGATLSVPKGTLKETEEIFFTQKSGMNSELDSNGEEFAWSAQRTFSIRVKGKNPKEWFYLNSGIKLKIPAKDYDYKNNGFYLEAWCYDHVKRKYVHQSHVTVVYKDGDFEITGIDHFSHWVLISNTRKFKIYRKDIKDFTTTPPCPYTLVPSWGIDDWFIKHKKEVGELKSLATDFKNIDPKEFESLPFYHKDSVHGDPIEAIKVPPGDEVTLNHVCGTSTAFKLYGELKAGVSGKAKIPFLAESEASLEATLGGDFCKGWTGSSSFSHTIKGGKYGARFMPFILWRIVWIKTVEKKTGKTEEFVCIKAHGIDLSKFSEKDPSIGNKINNNQPSTGTGSPGGSGSNLVGSIDYKPPPKNKRSCKDKPGASTPQNPPPKKKPKPPPKKPKKPGSGEKVKKKNK